MNADDLEARFLQKARDGYEVSRSEEDAALLAFERRLALAPLVGLPGLVLPAIPDPTAVAALVGKAAATSTATSVSAQTGALHAGTGAVQAGAMQATSLTAVGSKIGAGAAASSVGGAAAGGSTTAMAMATGFGTALLHLAPIKLVALTAALGGAAGATYHTVHASKELAAAETDEPFPNHAGSQASASAEKEPLRRKDISTDIPPPPLEELEEEISIETVEAAITLEALNKGPSKPSAPKKKISKISSFQEELAALREAQGAIKNGNGALALQLMSALDRDLPTGALVPERRMTKVLALCSVGRTREARHLARTVLDSSSGPMYSARIEKSCAKIELAQVAQPSDSSTETQSKQLHATEESANAFPLIEKDQQISSSPHTKK